MLLFLAFHGPSTLTLHAQNNAEQQVTALLGSWQVLSNNIQFSNLVSTNLPDGTSSAKGSVTAFGQTTTMKVDFKSIKVRRVMIIFPEGASLNTDLFRQLTGKEADKVLPTGLGAKISLKQFEIDC
ncbi:MAG: hypothetical protein LH618_00910, partial [Saprospiraceae bacterium]|nr:hypothetical protein [Saprospiraceae bacterium]